MLRNMNIGKRLLLGFGVIVLLLVCVGVLAIEKIGAIQERQQDFYEHPFAASKAIEAAHTNIVEINRSIKDALLARTGQEREAALALVDQSKIEAEKNLKLLKTSFRGDQQLVEIIVKDLEIWISRMSKTIELMRAGKRDAAIAWHHEQSRGIIAKIVKNMNEVTLSVQERAETLNRESGEIKDQTLLFTSALLFVAVLLAIAIALFITHSITRPLVTALEVANKLAVGDISAEIQVVSNDETGQLLQSMEKMLQQFRSTAEITRQIAIGNLTVTIVPQSEKDVMGNALVAMASSLREITREIVEGVNVLSSASSEILVSTNQVAAGASETAAAVSETTTTVEEIKQTAQVSSQKSRHVAESAQRGVQVAELGRCSVEASIGGMGRIQGQMEAIAESVVRLSEQSQTIGEIIATVNDLAEQSNLLAVNAAIEAAKAGEQGKGFAVVAQEVKSLAQQSKEATAQVRTILNDIQKATNAAVLATEQGSKAVETGVKQSQEASDSIRQMVESIDESAQAAAQIAVSSQQQLTGMDQVALAMENIRQASEQNVTGMRQVEVTVQGLHDLGQKLKNLVAQYNV